MAASSGFKKALPATVTSNQLKGSDAKKLRASLLAVMEMTEDALEAAVPSRAEISVAKLANRTLLYSVKDGNPICFDPEGRGEVLVPSMYLLFAAPDALPRVLTYSEVSPKILGGADLMLPGVIVPPGGLGDFKKGDLRAVAIPGNAVPFAVGVMETDAATVAASGLKGRGLRVLHAYPDHLWQAGDKATPEGFTPDRIFPTGAVPATVPPAAALAALAVNDSPAPAPAPASAAPVAPTPAAPAPAVAAGAPAPDGSTPAGMDAILDRCFVLAVCRVSDAELPMDAGAFYAGAMLPCRPEGVTVDIKKARPAGSEAETELRLSLRLS